jgi:phosphatidylserine/phosphatidylglycerophosphate/cardiolipin synthase-like enzyme
MRAYIGRSLGTFLELMIFSANKLLWVSSPSLSPKYAQKLVDLSKKGVDIKVITSAYKNEEAVNIIKNSLKPERNARGEIRGDWVSPPLDYLILKKNSSIQKVKMYIVDGKQAIIGSLSLTEEELYNSIEYIVILDDPRDVEKMMDDFISLWKLYVGLGDDFMECTRSFPSKFFVSRMT